MSDNIINFYSDILSSNTISKALFEMVHDKTGELRFIDAVCGKTVSNDDASLFNAVKYMTIALDEIINLQLLSTLLTYTNISSLDYRNTEVFEYILRAERKVGGVYLIRHNFLTASNIFKMIQSNDISEGGRITYEKEFVPDLTGNRKSHFNYIVRDKELLEHGITRISGDDLLVYVTAFYDYMLDHDKQNTFEFTDVERLKKLYSLLGNNLNGEGYLSPKICNDLLVKSYLLNGNRVTTDVIQNGRPVREGTVCISGYEGTALINIILNAYHRYKFTADELNINPDRFFESSYLSSIAPNKQNYHNISDKLMMLKGYLGILFKNPCLNFRELQKAALSNLGEDCIFFDRKEMAGLVTTASLFETVSNVRANKLTPIYNSFGHNDGHILTMIRSVKYGNYFYNHGNIFVFSRFYPDSGKVTPRVHVKIEDLSKILNSMWQEDLNHKLFKSVSDEKFDKSKSIVYGPENPNITLTTTSGSDD